MGAGVAGVGMPQGGVLGGIEVVPVGRSRVGVDGAFEARPVVVREPVSMVSMPGDVLRLVGVRGIGMSCVAVCTVTVARIGVPVIRM